MGKSCSVGDVEGDGVWAVVEDAVGHAEDPDFYSVGDFKIEKIVTYIKDRLPDLESALHPFRNWHMERVQKHEFAHRIPHMDNEFHDDHENFRYKKEGKPLFLVSFLCFRFLGSNEHPDILLLWPGNIWVSTSTLWPGMGVNKHTDILLLWPGMGVNKHTDILLLWPGMGVNKHTDILCSNLYKLIFHFPQLSGKARESQESKVSPRAPEPTV